MDALTKVSGTPLEHLPHSPDLTSCNFWAFPTMKRSSEVKIACSTILLKLAANGLQHIFKKWVEHCKKCIACQRRCFEKEIITAPPQSSNYEK
jgi:hypothetical protein